MAYLDPVSLHTLPAHIQSRATEPSSILFPTGPQWSRRYQKSKTSIDKPFVYTDQGPPMYRLLGRHYNVYKVPVKSNYHLPARDYDFELRQYIRPDHRNNALTFPPGPPPPQVAMYEGLTTGGQFNDPVPLEIPGRTMKNLQTWDKYRYMPGPPSETLIYKNTRDMQLPLV